MKLQDNGFPIEDENKPGYMVEKFIFHLQILMDNQLISDRNLYLSGLDSIGITMGLSGKPIIVNKDIRLTQRGHDFASALGKQEVFEKLKTEFKDAPFKVVFDGSQKLLQHFFKKKLNGIIDE
ncbi:DUF2513 domain-containing protein [Shewanella baltica]|uniref:DUF2513 domain-containing protein n=1 Tax=Shewanella baltica TaxID=62322 RepID=UPI00217E8A65|nr:DUF2513 domain-containing protein [Shewanella baltica]